MPASSARRSRTAATPWIASSSSCARLRNGRSAGTPPGRVQLPKDAGWSRSAAEASPNGRAGRSGVAKISDPPSHSSRSS